MVVLNHIEIVAAYVGAFWGVIAFVEPWSRMSPVDLLKVIACSFFAWSFAVFIKWEFVP